MNSKIQFLVRDVQPSQNSTMSWGEVFVDHNFICYFAERTVADGIKPSRILEDGSYKLALAFEEESWRIHLLNIAYNSDEVLSDNLLDYVPSWNGVWLSDRPQGFSAVQGTDLGSKVAKALRVSETSPSFVDATVLSWTLGTVIHMDAQAEDAPTSDGNTRISPDLTLSGQWDFDGLRFGDSATLSFIIPDNVTGLRIEYLVKSDLSELTKINYKLNNLDSIVGQASAVTSDEQERICVLITNPNRLKESLNSGENILKQTIATEAATIAIERIRLSYYLPDPIITWEFDGQLTQVRLMNLLATEAANFSLSIQWELLSGKSIDVSVLPECGLFSHGSSIEMLFCSQDSLKECVRDLIQIDHGTGNGRHGLIERRIDEIDLTKGIAITSNDPNTGFGPELPLRIIDEIYYYVGVYVQPVNAEGIRLAQRGQLLLNPDEVRNNLERFEVELPAGKRMPKFQTEEETIGNSNLPEIKYGSGEFQTFLSASLAYFEERIDGIRRVRRYGFDDDFLTYDNEFCRYILPDVRSRINKIIDILICAVDEIGTYDDDIGIKIIKGWVPRIDGSESAWAHNQGRAVNFIVVNIKNGNACPELLSRIAFITSHFFDFVEHVPADLATGEQAYIHASRRFDTPTLMHTLKVQEHEVMNKLAQAHWEQVADYSDTDLLDQIMVRFSGTDVSKAALSYRCDLVIKLVENFEAAVFDPDGRKEWEDQAEQVIYAQHQFLLKHSGRIGADKVRFLFFRMLRKMEDAYANYFNVSRSTFEQQLNDPNATAEQKSAALIGLERLKYDKGVVPHYLNFGHHYPASWEGRIAFARAYTLEYIRVKIVNSSAGYLEYMKDLPHSPHWEEIAELAKNKAVEDEISLLHQLKLESTSTAEFDEAKKFRHAGVFREQFQDTKELLTELFIERTPPDTTLRETETTYKNPHKARFLIETMRRLLHIADKLNEQYPGLHSDLGDSFTLFQNLEKLHKIEFQINDLIKLIKKNHSEVLKHIKIEEQKTRVLLREGFRVLLEGQSQLAAEIEDGFDEMQRRFDQVDKQLENIYENTSEILEKADEILDNQESIIVQLEAIEISVVQIIDQNTAIKKQLKSIEGRSSAGGSSSGGGWFEFPSRWTNGGLNKISDSTQAELGNLTKENIERWINDPAGTVHKRIQDGKSNFVAEVNRGITAVKSTWWYQKIQAALLAGTEDLLLENPGTANMETIPPDHTISDHSQRNYIYFVNGMNNSRTEARDHAKRLANLQNLCVRLIYNPSKFHRPHSTVPPGSDQPLYGDNDLLEAIYDRLWPSAVAAAPIAITRALISKARVQENPTTRHLAYQIYHDSKDGKEVRVVVHSQGSLICRNALLACQMLRGKTSNVSCVLAGPALSFDEMLPANDLANLTWIINKRDPVASLVGWQTDIPGFTDADGLHRREHNFSNDWGNNYGGKTYSGLKTYVRMVKPEHLRHSSDQGKKVYSTDD